MGNGDDITKLMLLIGAASLLIGVAGKIIVWLILLFTGAKL